MGLLAFWNLLQLKTETKQSLKYILRTSGQQSGRQGEARLYASILLGVNT